jgi:hypothetical protein
MPMLAGLAVVFAGIAGQPGHRVEQQLRALATQLHVQSEKIPAAALAIVGHHGEGARELVAHLHADGVIAGEYIANGGHAIVRLVIYSGDGGLRSLSEIPLTARALAADDLESLRANLADEVSALAPAHAAEPSPFDDVPDAPPAAPPPARLATKAEAAAPAAKRRRAEPKPDPEPEIDPTPAPASTSASPPADDTTAAPAADHDAVSVADIEAMTAGAGDAASVDAGAPAAATAGADELHLRAAAGLGLASRSFSGPASVPGYASSAVGVAQFAASVQPTARVALAGLAEHTLEMSTPLAQQMAPTSFSRWELSAAYALVHGDTLSIQPELGVGHRAFSIDSAAASASPAVDYTYAVIGARAAAQLGSRLALLGHFALEPVLSGADPMEMEFGAATRFAVDVGAAVEWRAGHVFARAAADYQRFSWAWNQAGARGAGGAVDGYPSGTLSLGANY